MDSRTVKVQRVRSSRVIGDWTRYRTRRLIAYLAVFGREAVGQSVEERGAVYDVMYVLSVRCMLIAINMTK
jgi:hypothetical protein